MTAYPILLLCVVPAAFLLFFVLGLLLAARLTGCRPSGSLRDLFVVPGLLLVFGLRLAEIRLGSLGAGRYLGPASEVSPSLFVIVNQYGEAHAAVFVWEAAAALAVALLSFTDRPVRPGARFETAVFRLCACQILLENMRSRCLAWGFVKVEQLLCAIILMVLLLLACARNTKKQGAVRFLPAVYLFLCIAAIIGIEFLRQRSTSRFMGLYGGYLMMGAVLCVILLIYRAVTVGLHLPRQDRNR